MKTVDDLYINWEGNADEAAQDPRSCVLRHVARASRAIISAYDPALASHGLTGHQFNLMTTLQHMGPSSVGALANMLGMDPSGIPRAVRPLSERGLIQTQRGRDRRQRMLNLTEAGHEIIEKATVDWKNVQGELSRAIGSERWMRLIGELKDLRNAATDCTTRKPESPGHNRTVATAIAQPAQTGATD